MFCVKRSDHITEDCRTSDSVHFLAYFLCEIILCTALPKQTTYTMSNVAIVVLFEHVFNSSQFVLIQKLWTWWKLVTILNLESKTFSCHVCAETKSNTLTSHTMGFKIHFKLNRYLYFQKSFYKIEPRLDLNWQLNWSDPKVKVYWSNICWLQKVEIKKASTSGICICITCFTFWNQHRSTKLPNTRVSSPSFGSCPFRINREHS